MGRGDVAAAAGEWLRRCRPLEHVDFRERWASREEAESAAAGEPGWRCERCGSGEWEIVPASPIGGG